MTELSTPPPVGRQVRQGGLMRCCIQSVAERGDAVDHEGEVMHCTYCKAAIVFRSGAWEWSGLDE